ncbi:MAG TPA: PA domain-containing protein [Candidatus Limnocylindrales bacterium]
MELELAFVNYARPEDIAKVDLKGKLAVWRASVHEPVWPGHPYGCSMAQERMEWLKAAGAVGVLIYNDERIAGGCPLPLYLYYPDPGYRSEIPVAQINHDEGVRLKRLLDAGPVRIEVNGNPDIEYTYHLSQPNRQRIPENLTYNYTSASLAQVDSSYHDAGIPGLADVHWHAMLPDTFSVAGAEPFLSRSRRTEYFGGFDPNVLWLGQADGPRDGDFAQLWKSVNEPSRTVQRWYSAPETFGSPDRPAIGSINGIVDCTMCRLGDVFVGVYSTMQPGGVMAGSWLNLTTQLRKDGAELPKVPRAGLPEGMPIWELPKQDGVYKLTQTHGDNSATWTFHSKTVTDHAAPPGYSCATLLYGVPIGVEGPCAPQPLVFVGYDFGDAPDLWNKITAGGKHALQVNAYHAKSNVPMPPIAGMNLWFSTDDGTTWLPARTTPTNQPGTYRTLVDIPALAQTRGAISLKVEAWDADGNRIEQTTLRAVTLK